MLGWLELPRPFSGGRTRALHATQVAAMDSRDVTERMPRASRLYDAGLPVATFAVRRPPHRTAAFELTTPSP
jgi:hypothetical protein